MSNATDEAIASIKAAGFTHLKVELEGDIGRDGDRECYECNGEGREECSYCEGEGAVQVEEYVGQGYRDNWVECEDCYGDGYRDCSDCDGSGNTGSYMDESTCDDFMKDYVPSDVRERLVYGNFYEDGSVDSEFTFTVAIEDYKDVLEWFKAFKALAGQCNGDIDVSGAGMHISVLTSGRYPTSNSLDWDGLENFQREVTKLLPALFFVASAGHQSRDLGYRKPQISNDDKYSAIYTHDGTCLEYRLFETCYDRPEAFFEYLQAISATLKYYSDTSARVKTLNKQFEFSDGNECARFFQTAEQLRVLNAQIKEVKPKDKTFKKLKQDRGVHYTIKSLAMQEKTTMQRLRADYQEYKKHYEQQLSSPLTADQQREFDYLITEHNYTPAEAMQRVKGIRGRLVTMRDFIRDNMPQMSRGYNNVSVRV